jgi:GAF domain-containing protein
MSAVLSSSQDAGSMADVGSRLAFFKDLQTVTNKIHATSNIDEIMLELSQDICNLFNADRLTIYSLGEDKASIVSKVKTGLNSFKDLRLPITDQSIAGYVALSRKIVNIRDVYDEAELKSIHTGLRFLQEVDKRTGYRTKQMLVSPIVEHSSGELLGVVQIINNKAGSPFAQVADEGVKGLCETLAIAFAQRSKPAQMVRSKYDFLVTEAVVTADELDLAKRTARKDGRSIEDVLIEQYQVTLVALGAALSKFFNVAL